MSDHLLLEVKKLKKHFQIRGGLLQRSVGVVHAIDGIDFSIKEGETMGLVGESGCGKTTAGRVILRFIDPTDGEIHFAGKNLLDLRKKDMRYVRRNMQMVFQDPQSSLDPRMTIKRIVGEPLVVMGVVRGKELSKRVQELLTNVGLSPEHLNRFPHEFSGGQRQRIVIARALALNPKFIVLDEPTSSLDVSVQATILNLLKDLQRDMGLTYLFISHNLSVIGFMCTKVAVMYLGQIVELAKKEDLFKEPLHPYTKALLSAIPIADPRFRKEEIIIEGEVPSSVSPPSGCRFHPRCPYAVKTCKKEQPQFFEVSPGHLVKCHLVHADTYPD